MNSWARELKVLAAHCNMQVYSFGILAWAMATGKPPYGEMRGLRVAHEVAYGGLRLEVPAACDSDLAELIYGCFALDPGDRPTFSDILQLGWLLQENEAPNVLHAAISLARSSY